MSYADPPHLILLRALDQRLHAAADCLSTGDGVAGTSVGSDEPGALSATWLPALIDALPAHPGPACWLMLVAVQAAFPLSEEVEALARRVGLEEPDVIARDLLSEALRRPRVGRLDLPMTCLDDAVVVDVDYCSRYDTNTGIQRVVRNTLPRWLSSPDRNVVATAVLDQRTGYRSLAPHEAARVFQFGRQLTFDPEADSAYTPELIVPWETTVVLPEVPDPLWCPRLRALAQYSGNRVSLIAYDMIPIVSTELRPFGEAGIFARYLSVVKHAHRVAGISSSATTEFQGFADMISAQGLSGPIVAEVELAEEVDHTWSAADLVEKPRPVVLCPGRREPHKNVRAALHAAERLWNEARDFEVVMLGGHGWDEEDLNATIERLQQQGRPLTRLGWVSDAQMWQQFNSASFTVFPSLHEGYGLPISESLACGTPVITTNYGSQREVAEKGGCLMVDPRSDSELTDAMRTLLTQPDRLAQLRDEIVLRPRRTWDDYADDLWEFSVHEEDGRAGA